LLVLFNGANYMSEKVTTMARAQMKSWKAALELKLRELTNLWQERDELYIEQHADPADQVQSSSDRDMAVLRFNQETRLMHEVESALAKVEAGSFGICEDCEEPIPQKPLDAIPWARLCVKCQSKAEAAMEREDTAFYDAA
jgi:DnaK suppressor protein